MLCFAAVLPSRALPGKKVEPAGEKPPPGSALLKLFHSGPKPGSALLGSANRASAGASAAIDAGIGIDHIFAVALGDSSNGAFAGASAAGNTFVADDIGHEEHLHLNLHTHCNTFCIKCKCFSTYISQLLSITNSHTSIMQGVAVMFAAQAFGIQLTPMDYITVIGTATLASIGTAGIPSVGLVTLTMVFNSVGLPVEAIGIIMGIDRILDMARTAVNITGDAVCTTIVACQNGAVDKEVFNKAE